MKYRGRVILWLLLMVQWLPGVTYADHKLPPVKREALIAHIRSAYPKQFTNPEKKTRKTFSQFGYNLYEFPIPIFPITKFIRPDKFGQQSYGVPNRRKEKNGALYTCRGGFIDFSHMRAAADWTVYLSFQILADDKSVVLPWEAGELKLQFRDLDELDEEDIVNMAQKIAFERLVWHEIASWHYHAPYHLIGEQSSAFTPEDLYSNFLGTEIGKRIALRILTKQEPLSYSQIATEEIQKMISSLGPVASKKDSKHAYDVVDLNKQRRLPAEERNEDVWYDSKIVFHDQRYVFKRYMNIGPAMSPWLIPEPQKAGCPVIQNPAILYVPQRASTGRSYYDYYTFTITPDTNMFYDYKRHRQLHPPFSAFTTKHMSKIVAHIHKQMEGVLMPGFDKRNDEDPTIYYTDAKKVFLK